MVTSENQALIPWILECSSTWWFQPNLQKIIPARDPKQCQKKTMKENATTPPQQHHHKNTTTPPQQKHHHTTTKTPPQKHHHTTGRTPPQKHHHKKHNHKKHHHKNTTTQPQKQLNVWAACVSTMCGHSMCEHSMWARTPKSTKTTTKNEHQFLGRMWQNAEKYENHHANLTSVLGPDVAAPKTSKKCEFYCKNPVQEHCRTPKSTRITTKNEHRRSWSAEKVRKFTDETRFRPFQEHRRTPESTRITTKNEHRRSWRAGNYENLQTKPAGVGAAKPKTTKIHRRNEHASTKARK